MKVFVFSPIILVLLTSGKSVFMLSTETQRKGERERERERERNLWSGGNYLREAILSQSPSKSGKLKTMRLWLSTIIRRKYTWNWGVQSPPVVLRLITTFMWPSWSCHEDAGIASRIDKPSAVLPVFESNNLYTQKCVGTDVCGRFWFTSSPSKNDLINI